MINKYLFGLLVNTIAIFASISTDVVAKEGLHKFRNQLNQIYWRIACDNIENWINETEIYTNDKWILDDKYKKSRTTVIGQAIADCVTGENEFKDKNAGDIITFEGTNPETYKQKHWNAVILYNYINEALNGEELPDYQKSKEEAENLLNDENEYIKYVKNVQNILNSKYKDKSKIEMIENYYKDYYKKQCPETANELIRQLPEKLGLAIKYIQDYVEALDLNSYLWKFYSKKIEYANNQNIGNLAPDIDDISDDWSISYLSPFSEFKETGGGISAIKREAYYPTFRYHNGKLYLTELLPTKESWNMALNDFLRYETLTKINDGDTIKIQYGWILDRLQGLVEAPNEKCGNKPSKKIKASTAKLNNDETQKALKKKRLEELESKASKYQEYRDELASLAREEVQGVENQAGSKEYYDLKDADQDEMIKNYFGNKSYYEECQQAYYEYFKLQKMMEEQKQRKAQKSKKKI